MEFPGEPSALEDLSLEEIRLRYGAQGMWAEVVRRGRKMPPDLQRTVREMAGCCAELDYAPVHCLRPLGHEGPHRGPGAPPVEGAGREAQQEVVGVWHAWTEPIDAEIFKAFDGLHGVVWTEELVTVKQHVIESPLAIADARIRRRRGIPLDTWAARQEQARRARENQR